MENASARSKKKKIVIICVIVVAALLLCAAAWIFISENSGLKEAEEALTQAITAPDEVTVEYGEELTYEEMRGRFVNWKKAEGADFVIEKDGEALSPGDKLSFDELGEYEIKIYLMKHAQGRLSFISADLTAEKSIKIIVEDTEKPVITGIEDLTVTVGDTLDLLAGLKAEDNVDGEVEVTTEDKVDTTKAGEYEVTVRAEDKSGNVSEEKFTVTVVEKGAASQSGGNYSGKGTSSGKGSSGKGSSGSSSSGGASSGGSSSGGKTSFTDSELLAIGKAGMSTYGSQINTILNRTNEIRKAAGAPALRLDSELTQAACMRAAEISTGYFSHTRPNGTPWYTINDRAFGENIAQNTTIDSVMLAWQKSKRHYENMINSGFTVMGVGVYKVGANYYCVQLFG